MKMGAPGVMHSEPPSRWQNAISRFNATICMTAGSRSLPFAVRFRRTCPDFCRGYGCGQRPRNRLVGVESLRVAEWQRPTISAEHSSVDRYSPAHREYYIPKKFGKSEKT